MRVMADSNPRLALAEAEVEPPIFNIRPMQGCRCHVVIKCDPTHQLKYPVNEEFVFIIEEADDDLDDQLEEELRAMKTGDIKHVVFDGNEEKFNYEVKMLNIKNRKIDCELTVNEKYDIALHHKEKGVELFMKGLAQRAFRRFSVALKYLILMQPSRMIPDDLKDRYTELRVQCYSNMALCQMKVNSYTLAVENCTKGLKIDCSNVKCLYRRAECYLYLNEFEKSREDIVKGLKIEPNSKSFCTLMKKLQDCLKQGVEEQPKTL